MKILFLFLDGVGLGVDDPSCNPLARAEMPTLVKLLDGERLVIGSAPKEGRRASLRALDACLGISGLPQSATGQATLLTGKNIPQSLGYHYGPKPNPAVAEWIKNGNLFSWLEKEGKRSAYLNAFPPRYFENIKSGLRIYAAFPLAAASAGVPLRTRVHLKAGEALAADFTGLGWRTHLGLLDTPVINPYEAGQRLAQLGSEYDFSLFEYWLSDYAGHGQDMSATCSLLESFDQVLAGVLERWDESTGLVLITSDHGNMEDLSTRRHTVNPVPAVVIGAPELRREFTKELHDIAGVAPAILRNLLR